MPAAEKQFQPLYELLSQGRKLALAVSGGPDSTALMVLAARWARAQNRLETLHVLTVDHGLRAGSGADAEKVCHWVTARGLQCKILRWQHDNPVSAVQEKARAGRYQLMADWCANNNFEGVVTAHHGADQAETMMMRLARGSGVDGLSAMGARSEIFGLKVYRPLLNVSGEDLRAVLEDAGQSWLKDPANHNEKFERVRVRSAMAAIEAAGIDQAALGLSAKRLARARSALEAMTDRFMARSVTVFNTGHCEIERTAFEVQPDEICLRILNRLILWAGGAQIAVRMAKVERLLDELGSNKNDKHTLAGARIAVRKNSIVIGREFGRIASQLQENVTAWDHRFIFDKPRNVQPYGLFIDSDNRQRPPELPYFVACSLPVFCDDHHKILVPHLDLGDETGIGLVATPDGVAGITQPRITNNRP